MQLNYLFQILIVFQLFISFSSLATPCTSWNDSLPQRDGEASIIASTEKVQLNEILFFQNVLGDSMDIEFWVEECVNNHETVYSLFGTVTPSVAGKSQGSGYYEVEVIQNNQSFGGRFRFGDTLVATTDFWLQVNTNYYYGTPMTSRPPGLDINQPFTLILSCLEGSIYDNCIAANSGWSFDITPQLDNESQTITSINGAWYDPEYNGSGFSIIQTPAGFFMFYYGYRAETNGEALWLISAVGPQTIKKGEAFTLEMYSGFIGNGGSLTAKPITANSGVKLWGTATIILNSCNSGEIKLVNNDGVSVTQNIIQLAAAEGQDCI